MSIVNAFVSPECAVVCADTEAGPDGGPYTEVSKLVPLPHMNAVVAFRGSMLFLSGALTGMFVSGCGFDELSRQMPDLLKLSSDTAIRMLPRVDLAGAMTSEEAGYGEAILVGFSPTVGRIVGHHFRRQTLDSGFVTTNNVSYFSAPAWNDVDLALPSLHNQPSREGLKELALAQMRLVRERNTPGEAAGGRLIYAEIRRDSMTVEAIMDFPARPTS